MRATPVVVLVLLALVLPRPARAVPPEPGIDVTSVLVVGGVLTLGAATDLAIPVSLAMNRGVPLWLSITGTATWTLINAVWIDMAFTGGTSLASNLGFFLSMPETWWSLASLGLSVFALFRPVPKVSVAPAALRIPATLGAPGGPGTGRGSLVPGLVVAGRF